MPTFAPATDRVVNTSWGSSRQGVDVVGLWLHHQADGAGHDANDYMIGANDRGSHPTYGIDDDTAATVVGIVHPSKAPSSTFYANDQNAVAIEAANTTGEPEWRTPEATPEKIALIVAHHALESPRAAHPIEANKPGQAQRGFYLGWHSQVRQTACPGPYLVGKIPWIVARANQIKDAIQAGASWSDVITGNLAAKPAAPVITEPEWEHDMYIARVTDWKNNCVLITPNGHRLIESEEQLAHIRATLDIPMKNCLYGQMFSTVAFINSLNESGGVLASVNDLDKAIREEGQRRGLIAA